MFRAFKTAIINFLALVTPFSFLKGLLPKQAIFYGHLVTGKDHVAAGSYRYPSLKEFDSLVAIFKKLEYSFVTMDEFLREDNQKKILWTFDDGFKVIQDELHPYMRQRNIPYTLFVLTDPLDNPLFSIKTLETPSGGNRLFLSETEILELKEQNVHIGFHTRGHRKIENSDNPEALIVADELTIPIQYKHLFSEPICFAYPYLAPSNYNLFNGWMKDHLQAELFFDTKGFGPRDGNHFFRASIDGEKTLKMKNWLIFVIKRQLILYFFSKLH